jgi:hypothetical protein
MGIQKIFHMRQQHRATSQRIHLKDNVICLPTFIGIVGIREAANKVVSDVFVTKRGKVKHTTSKIPDSDNTGSLKWISAIA